MVKDESERPIAPDANGLGSCPICCATIGGGHLFMLEAGYTAEGIHLEHQRWQQPEYIRAFLQKFGLPGW